MGRGLACGRCESCSLHFFSVGCLPRPLSVGLLDPVFSDFADEFPNAEVIGTDVTPIQRSWVPPNVKFELDDCNKEWTWPNNTFDFVNLRYLIGVVDDWDALFRNAYRVAKPGAYVESLVPGSYFLSDDGTVKEGSSLDQWGRVFREGGKRIGRTFSILEEDLQRKGMEAAGFVDIEFKDFRCPMGTWPSDKEEAEKALWQKFAVEADLEGKLACDHSVSLPCLMSIEP